MMKLLLAGLLLVGMLAYAKADIICISIDDDGSEICTEEDGTESTTIRI